MAEADVCMTGPTTSAEMNRVYKICTQQEWDQARRAGIYTGSKDDVRDGFIHLSTSRQLAATLAKHFSSIPNLVLISLDSVDLTPALKWERSRNEELFPHLYDTLDPQKALATYPLAIDKNGKHILPETLDK